MLSSSEPGVLLERLVQVVLRLCNDDSAGISVESIDAGGKAIFRWIATAGELGKMIGGPMSREFSPCGLRPDRKQPKLMKHLGRMYPYFQSAPNPFIEALLFPWPVQSGLEGTLWVVAHNDQRNFDLHDVRVLSNLATFAFGAIGLQQSTHEAERIAAGISIKSEMAHHLNNPLQAAMLLLFRMKTESTLNNRGMELLGLLETQIERVAGLSSQITCGNSRGHAA